MRHCGVFLEGVPESYIECGAPFKTGVFVVESEVQSCGEFKHPVFVPDTTKSPSGSNDGLTNYIQSFGIKAVWYIILNIYRQEIGGIFGNIPAFFHAPVKSIIIPGFSSEHRDDQPVETVVFVNYSVVKVDLAVRPHPSSRQSGTANKGEILAQRMFIGIIRSENVD